MTDPKTALAKFQSGAGILPAKDRRDARPTLIIDGLFGIGLNRALDDDWKKFIAAVNASKIPVLAVDVPSGLNAETGEHFGAAIEAAVTLTVGAPKIGMLAQNAWPFVGRLEVAEDVGLIPCPHQNRIELDAAGRFPKFSATPRRSPDTKARSGIWRLSRAVLVFTARQF